MAVRQYALHFSRLAGWVVFLSTVASFLLVFSFGVYIGKEVQAYKTAQETRTMRFPVEPADHNASVSPGPPALPLTSETLGERENKGKAQAKEEPPRSGRWSIQVHVTKSQSTANQLAAELRKQGYTTAVNRLIKDGETLYRLRVGTFTQEEAQRAVVRFRREENFAQAYLVSD